MITILPIVTLDETAYRLIQAGYQSHEKYQVSKLENPDQTVITLRRMPLPDPYNRTWPIGEEDRRRYHQALQGNYALGAYIDGQLVGIALAEPHAWNRSLWVWEFHVAKAYQRQGIGRQLMATLAEKGRAAGLRCLVCETQNTNTAAIDFYRAVGFEIDGVDLSYYSNQDIEQGEVALFMKLKLA